MYFSKCKNGDKVCSNNCTISQVERFVESSTTPGECIDSSNIKHSSDCSKYYKCDHGNPAMKLCSPGTLFNHILSVCDWPVNVYKVRPECLEETIYETMANKLLTSTSEGPMLYAPQTESNPYTKNTSDSSYVIISPDDYTTESLLVISTPRTPLPLCNSERFYLV